MEWTGKVLSVGADYLTGQMNITLSINERSALQEIDSIKDCEKLSIKAVKHRNKRSLDSNAYAWVLMQKIAEAVNSDRWSVYLEMLKKYSREFTFVICKEHAVDKLKELYRTCIDLGEGGMAKRLKSVFTDDMEHCIETGTSHCHRHHIFGASNRSKSEKYGFVIPIAYWLHEFQPGSIHANPNQGLDLKWKQKAQEYFEEHYGTREDFRREFGKSYL